MFWRSINSQSILHVDIIDLLIDRVREVTFIPICVRLQHLSLGK